ncbi:coagulation factor 5/8 type domain-containing protein [Venturia nashicola]|uniref:Coagulation factor 5/8 type domain-containing protein n=1 Tax=Venturia nashicola TaxID=86259 RepID=A0A4Z1PC75_9PEZI|nr:coagulation factor 5/8 type domain-containing protein [Venturia nashicola]
MAASETKSKVEVYPFYPSIHQLSDAYIVTVNGFNIPVTEHQPYDYAHFSMQGPVQITIAKTKKFGSVGEFSISPLKLGLMAKIKDNRIDFILNEPHYLIIKFDDRRELVLLADPLENDREAVDIRDCKVHVITSKTYLADNKGKDYATASIQSAINDATTTGGGIVYIPPGIYKTGNLILKSNVHLYLSGGSVLRYTGAPEIYEPLFTKFDRKFTYWIRTDLDSSNIKITGRGIIDGDGKATYSNPKNLGVTLLAPTRTTNFFFSGPILKEASFWNTIVMYSNTISFSNLKLLDRFDMGENDGIDIVESSSVIVKRAIAISWDDPFSTKTYDPGQAGGFEKIPGPALAIRDVLFEELVSWTGLFGVKIGQGFQQPQSHVTFRDVVVYDCSCAIGIHHKYGDGLGSNILFENVDVERISSTVSERRTWLALFVERDNQKGVVGTFGDVTVRNVVIRDMGITGGEIRGWNSSIGVGKVTLEKIEPKALGRTARTLEEMGITKIEYAPSIKIVAQGACLKFCKSPSRSFQK